MTRLPHRLALATALATLVLIVAGGIVTNTGSGLAVPDWPNTFGHNMFLFPWSGMVGGILWEHSHRLIGSLVGLLTVVLAATLWRLGGTLRLLGIAAVLAVVAQGVLGGLRVVLLDPTLAIVHGCVAPAFFGLICAIAWLTSPDAAGARPAAVPAVRALALAAAAVTYLQIVLGALVTHTGHVEAHVLGAVVVFALMPILTARLRRSADPVGARAARWILVVLGLQLVLGTGSFVVRYMETALTGTATALVFPVAHRAAASVLFGLVVVVALRLVVAAAGHARNPALGGLASAPRGSG